MSDRDPPRLVVVNVDADLERRQAEKERSWAEQEVSWTLRRMTANLIRVARGAGKPYDIADHAQDFIRALVKYREVCGDLTVMDQLPAMLSIRNERLDRAELTGAEAEERYGVEEIIRGALQITASRLVGQNTQERAGESELHSGSRRLEDALAELRREREREARTAVKSARPGKPKRS